MKILILLTYYERPQMVREALRSVLACYHFHPDWELAFIDDSSPTPGCPVAEEIMAPCAGRVRYYNTETPREQKIERGSELGKCLNLAMRDSDADLCISLNDDDRLEKHYLRNLSEFMESRPTHPACFSKVHLSFPAARNRPELKPLIQLLSKHCPYNQWTGFISPYLTVEWCQVAWRLTPVKAAGVWFEEVCDANHDAFFFKRWAETFGPSCGNTTFYSQWKTYHRRQATRRAFDPQARWASDPVVLYGDAEGPDDDARIVFDEAIAQAKFWCNHGRSDISKEILMEVLDTEEVVQAGLLLAEIDRGEARKYEEVESYVEALKRAG